MFERNNAQVHSRAGYNEGLREYLASVFRYMAMALGITGAVALLVASSPALLQAIFGTPLAYLFMFAPLIVVFYFSMKVHSMSVQSAQTAFWVYAVLMGVSMSVIFLAYTGESIAKTFFIAASMFGGMAIYGNTTKRDLSAWRTFLFMGVIGLLVAMLVNLFMQSSMMAFIISAAGVLIFTGLTAYDMQKIKESYYAVSHHEEMAKKVAIFGALQLYIDFINIFIHLLHLLGARRD
jgi:FtsH-binding integral membrane protein